MNKIWKHVSVATSDGIGAIMNTSATVGFGTVIAKSVGFAALIPLITDLPVNPLISSTITASLLSAIAGSASGGLGIAVPIVTFLNYSKTTHKEGYGNIFMVSLATGAVCVILLLVSLALTGYM